MWAKRGLRSSMKGACAMLFYSFLSVERRTSSIDWVRTVTCFIHEWLQLTRFKLGSFVCRAWWQIGKAIRKLNLKVESVERRYERNEVNIQAADWSTSEKTTLLSWLVVGKIEKGLRLMVRLREPPTKHQGSRLAWLVALRFWRVISRLQDINSLRGWGWGFERLRESD